MQAFSTVLFTTSYFPMIPSEKSHLKWVLLIFHKIPANDKKPLALLSVSLNHYMNEPLSKTAVILIAASLTKMYVVPICKTYRKGEKSFSLEKSINVKGP